MDIHFLNLDRRPDREQRFRALNAHAGRLIRRDCIDGPVIGIEGLRNHGVELMGNPYYRPSSAANQISHLNIIREASQSRLPTIICEDDAVLRHDFAEIAPLLFDDAPKSWDMLFFGWTFSTALVIELVPGSRQSLIASTPAQSLDEAWCFQLTHQEPQLWKCWAAFNSFCYAVSPDGARKLIPLLEGCKPCNMVLAAQEGVKPIYGIDAVFAAHCGTMNNFVAFPPLAYHPHDPLDTDMLEPGAPIRDTRNRNVRSPGQDVSD